VSSYSYQAVDGSGQQVRGIIEAETPDEASKALSGRGLYVLSIGTAGNLWGSIRKLTAGKRVKRSELIDFAGNLSVMVGAGLPVLTTLGDLAAATTNTSFQAVITQIRQDIELGRGFSEAIESHPETFPDIFARLVRVGEETGRFEKSLSDVAEHMQRIEDLSSSIKRAMIYPIFAIVTTLAALVFWMVFVLPKMIVTLKGLGVKLPLLTRGLILASHITQNYWYVALILPVMFVVIFRLMKRSEAGRLRIDQFKLVLPVYSMIEINRLLALFSEQMRIMIVAGLTFDRTLGITAQIMGNEVFGRALTTVREEITYGSGIADALRRHKVFPALLVRMVGVGERSGTLDTQFSFLAVHYLKKLDDISEKLGKIIEPMVIIFVGILFAVIILGLLLPIYDLVSQVGKG